MDILLTFTGNRDHYNPEIVNGVFTDGPVLTLLAERSFAAIHIFTTPNTLPNAQQPQREIAKRSGGVENRIHNLDIPDPTDYEAFLLQMNALSIAVTSLHVYSEKGDYGHGKLAFNGSRSSRKGTEHRSS
jgi:hypothetical protein